MSIAAARRARHLIRRPDPWLVLSCLVAAGVYLLHGFGGALGKDTAVYSYAGQQVADGLLPYVAIINRSGPLSHAVPGIGVLAARAVGVDDVLGIRALLMVISVACVGLAYVLGRDLFRSRPAGLVTAATLLSFEVFTRYATYGPSEKTLLVLCLLAMLLATLRRRWLTAGLFVALGTLTWQPVFLLALTGTVVAILLGPPSGRLRALGRVAVGGLAPALVTLAAYVLAGELRYLLEDFLLINLQFTRQPSILDSPTFGWRSISSGFGVSAWGFLAGMVALLVLSVRALTGTHPDHDPRRADLVGAGAALGTGLRWSLKAYYTWPDAFVLLPMAALGVGGLAARLAERLDPRVALATSLAWVLVATGIALSYSWDSRKTNYEEQRAGYSAVLGLLPADARILGIEAPEALVFARQRNLTRYQLLGGGLLHHLDATWPGGRRGFVRWVLTERPALVVIGDAPMVRWLPRLLDDEYRPIGWTPGRVWLVPRALDRDTARAIQVTLETKLPVTPTLTRQVRRAAGT